MIKKYKDYLILLVVILLVIFSPNINNFLYGSDDALNIANINNSYCVSLENDYNELLEMNNFNTNKGLNLIMSKVIFRDIYEFSDTLTIYKGSTSGIKEGLAVINNQGLIGVITKVYKNSSIVELITNKNSNISVKIGNNYGILKFQNNDLIVSDLQTFDEINIGDEIYTSGIGNLPRDIYIGKVTNVNLNSTEIEKIVSVKSAVDFSSLNYLLVVD